ncbi:delta-60 repeat domain-containing protein [Pseudomonas sp. P97.38]|uniref:delta-60 repeat domain-containing protein n=1 Tax=Pseudomonas sp. P97.38 TaxID=255451 RepID=UPI00069E4165|nr:delta-60 repeat domain-containing protein [Pseudomonas sp. P97.38]
MTQPAHTTKAGTLDPSFADEGVLKFPTPEISGVYTEAVLALPANRILLGMTLMGGPGRPTVIVRLNEDGSIDTDFGGNGTGLIEIPIAGAELDIRKLYGLSDGGYLVMGQFRIPSDSGLYLVRYREDWQLDEAFGQEGVLLVPYSSMGNPTDVGIGEETAGSSEEEPSAGAPRVSGSKGATGLQQLDGKIFLTHVVTTKTGQRKGIVLRLNSDGSTDYTFNERGFVLVELEGIDYEYNSAGALAVQADGKVLVAGDFRLAGQNYRSVYVTRFDAMGRLDRTFNGGTVTVRNAGGISLRAIEVREADGSIVAVGDAMRDGVRNGVMFVITEG